MDKPSGADSFSRWYRFTSRLEYMLLHVFGPATGNGRNDPRVRNRREYERRRDLHEQWLVTQGRPD
ncbi:hypothetical protein [Brevibacterium ihuae]|uniref:hypothetical protein n=1 Tax=Brevibacterium ihuae TaxID=1631743 RepID=UPI000C78F4A6|nr:hypothetical protein [Brevibacterium ihuae]